MVLKKNVNLIIIVLLIPLLTGCTVNYNLDISAGSITESLEINSIEIENSEYYVPAYYNSIGDEYLDVDINQRIEGIEYYNAFVDNNSIKFNYKFKEKDYFDSNIANSFYSNFVFKKYDYDEDGKEDYYILSSSNDFSAFSLYEELSEVNIKIKTTYEVISCNADVVNGNEYVWYLTPDDIPVITMIYNPDKVVDNRTFVQKLLDGDYFNSFTISILITAIGVIVFGIFKLKGILSNRV